jgi:hypothetical protein
MKKAGLSRKTAQTGAATLIQRFGSALNLNVHFHMLFLDGVYVERSDGALLDEQVGMVAGFNLHAGVAARADERKKLERLCRYISRPAVSEKRLSLTPNGNIRYQLKTPYRDGTTHVIFEPLDFMARLAALVPKPRVNLTRFHGVFAPNSKHRAMVTPAKRGKGNKARVPDEPPKPAECRASMTWAQRLKRVFGIEIETCPACGGAVKVIACIEAPVVIKRILDHLKQKVDANEPSRQYRIGNQTLAFKKAALKDTGFRHRKSALVVEALKALGRERVDATAIHTIREYLGPEDCARVLRETRPATGWIYQIIKQVCEEAG